MADKQLNAAFSDTERAALHSLAEMFQDKNDRDALRRLLDDGATIKQLITAYRTQKGALLGIKFIAGLIVAVGGAWFVIKGGPK